MSPNRHQPHPIVDFLRTPSLRLLLFLNIVLALIYFALLISFPQGNPILFWSLILGEIFHLFQIVGFAHAVWNTNHHAPQDPNFIAPVDVFITVAGEPVEIVEETARAAAAMQYAAPVNVTILNDGYVTNKDNWQEIEQLAKKLKVSCITRRTPGGAKAGNINNGLRQTTNPFVVILDADHVPHPDLLQKMMPFFCDDRMGFVQSPQYYKNHHQNPVTAAAWEQQELFFGPLSKGKSRLNSTFMCGTNMIVRRAALEEVGGMAENNIAEDFLTSLFVHSKGWKSTYVPEVLAEGLAPEDFLSYDKQQFRWARGSLEIIFRYNPLFRRGLSFNQRLQYLASASYFLSGSVVVMNAALPLVFFFTGAVPIQVSTMVLAAIFLPYIFLTIYTLQVSSGASYTFRAVAFSLSSFTIQLRALWAVLTNQKTGFAVTAKRAVAGNFISLVRIHIAYIVLVLIGMTVAVLREGLNASVVTNLSWASLYIASFTPFIVAAWPRRTHASTPELAAAPSNSREP